MSFESEAIYQLYEYMDIFIYRVCMVKDKRFCLYVYVFAGSEEERREKINMKPMIRMRYTSYRFKFNRGLVYFNLKILIEG